MPGQHGTRGSHAMRTCRKHGFALLACDKDRIPAQQVLLCWRATRSPNSSSTRQNHGFASLACNKESASQLNKAKPRFCLVGVQEGVRMPAQQGKTMVLPCCRATRSPHPSSTTQNHSFALLACNKEFASPAQKGQTMVLQCWGAARSQHATATRQNHGFSLLPCNFEGLVSCLLSSET